jgi:hypothetical protein
MLYRLIVPFRITGFLGGVRRDRYSIVHVFVLSGTGAPVALVKRSGFDIMNSPLRSSVIARLIYEA